MRTIIAAVAIALATAILAFHSTPSGAQVPSLTEKPKHKESEGEAKMRAAAKRAEEKAYKDAIGNTPDQKLDPWRNLR